MWKYRFINLSSFYYLNSRFSLEFNIKNKQHAKSPWVNCSQYLEFRDSLGYQQGCFSEASLSQCRIKNKISLPEHSNLDSLLCLRLRESQSHWGHRGLDLNPLLRAGPAMRSAWLAHAFIHIFILDIYISSIYTSKIDIFCLGYFCIWIYRSIFILDNSHWSQLFSRLTSPLSLQDNTSAPFSWWPSTEPAPACPCLSCAVVGPKLDTRCKVWSAECQGTAGTCTT